MWCLGRCPPPRPLTVPHLQMSLALQRLRLAGDLHGAPGRPALHPQLQGRGGAEREGAEQAGGGGRAVSQTNSRLGTTGTSQCAAGTKARDAASRSALPPTKNIRATHRARVEDEGEDRAEGSWLCHGGMYGSGRRAHAPRPATPGCAPHDWRAHALPDAPLPKRTQVRSQRCHCHGPRSLLTTSVGAA